MFHFLASESCLSLQDCSAVQVHASNSMDFSKQKQDFNATVVEGEVQVCQLFDKQYSASNVLHPPSSLGSTRVSLYVCVCWTHTQFFGIMFHLQFIVHLL